MDLSIGGGGNIPVSALNCFDTLAILLLVPVFDGYLYPFFKRRGYDVSMLAKMQWGFFFAFLSMLAAAFVEIARLQYKAKAGNYYDAAARDNITPCQNIDDFNPYNYQVKQTTVCYAQHFPLSPLVLSTLCRNGTPARTRTNHTIAVKSVMTCTTTATPAKNSCNSSASTAMTSRR